jgi:hypothetical protein
MPGAFDLEEMHSLLPGIQRWRNLDSPADEVLRRIFGYIQFSAEVVHPELIIASTTHHWREVALKIPSLWTTVRVNHDRQISVLGDILLRSQNLPLDIYIRLETFKYRFFTDYMEAVNLLSPHVARWRLLSVIAMNPVLTRSLHESTTCLCLPWSISSSSSAIPEKSSISAPSYLNHRSFGRCGWSAR